jgi:hypothetical protein
MKHEATDEMMMPDSAFRKKKLPDVYLIVADEYAGIKNLADVCGFDNSPFYDSLRMRNFFVASHSRSNYNYTTYSIASLLNMEYLPLNKKQVEKADHTYALNRILKNKVTSIFRKAGYQIRNYSAFDIGTPDILHTNSFIPSRTTFITEQTLLSRLKKDVWMNAIRILGFRKILRYYLLENLRYNQKIYELAVQNIRRADARPEFVYIHLQLPHYPYYYDSSGRLYPLEKISQDTPGNTKSYVQYVQYTNPILLTLIDQIFKHQVAPPVIILMSDHGYRSFPEKLGNRVVFLNLFSVYLPDKNYHLFHDSVTNVNTFRLLFNSAFNQALPLMKDSTLFIKD